VFLILHKLLNETSINYPEQSILSIWSGGMLNVDFHWYILQNGVHHLKQIVQSVYLGK